MKILINKHNPEIRITAPEITLENHCYCLYTDDGDCVIEFWEKDWTLVEEKSVNLEKELENRIKSLEPYFEALDNYCTEKIMSLCDGTKVKPSLDIVDITDCIIDVAKHFYELGRKGGSK